MEVRNGLLTIEEMALELKVPKSWLYSRTRETGPDAMPRLKVGKYVRGIMIDSLESPQDFWDFYKANKDQLRAEGFSVSNYGGWMLNWWTVEEDPFADPVIEEEPEEVKSVPLMDSRMIDIIDNSLLYDYQKPHTAKIIQTLYKNNCLDTSNAFLDTSGTGSGKTYCALIAAKALGLKPFVVCPKPVIYSWVYR